MSKNRWMSAILILAISSLAFLILQYQNTSDWFIEYSLPLTEAHRFFDIGIVDANGDNNLDIYTSNHHFRQALLISDGQGGYRDVLSEWGLDQSRAFPLAELSFITPEVDKPGLYIHWIGTQLVVQAHKISEIGQVQGSLQLHDTIEIKKNQGFAVENNHKILSVFKEGTISATEIKFSTTDTDAYLRMKPGGQGVPIIFHLDDKLLPTQIYVGRGKVSPGSSDFSLTMKDRHAMAWADYNNDGKLDIFINRGALGGTLRAFPQVIQQRIKDELLISRNEGQFDDVASEIGIEKKGCSGRHARWLDFNQDGLLDLYINCHDRKNVLGKYPKQLYLQDKKGEFKDMALHAAIGMPDQQIGSLTWADVDNDSDADLVTFQDDGIFLYRNNAGRFSQEALYRGSFAGTKRIGSTAKGEWVYDGKLTLSDYDADGDLDIFSASKRGNILLTNNRGRFTPVIPTAIGLPEKSLNANWVDYDNDGLLDLHTVPQGIFRQGKEHGFESTNLLVLPSGQYLAAVCNWFDLDNDGRQDLLMALKENPSFERWWDFTKKSARFHTTWRVKTYRNVGSTNHWLQIKLIGSDGNRQAIGAQVTAVTPNGEQTQEVGSSEGAFFSQGHYRLYFGLGENSRVDLLKIRWSDGNIQQLENIAGNKLHIIKRKPGEYNSP